MKLKDYTTEQLKAEIKRREREERQLRSTGRSYKAEYAYAIALITYVSDDPYIRRQYKIKVCKKDCEKYQLNISYKTGTGYAYILQSRFNKGTAPKLGDMVRIKSRKTKSNPNGFGLFSTPIIYEIIC